MPGNSPGEAVENFLEPIKLAVSCVGSAVLVYRDHPALDVTQTATLNAGEGLTVNAAGHYDPQLRLEIELAYRAIHCPDDEIRGPYRCTSVAYILGLYQDATELMAFHWHPEQNVSPEKLPHFHVGEGVLKQHGRLHVPTPRVTVEEFIEVAIDSFGVVAVVGEDVWRPILEESRERHEKYRSWANRDDAPVPAPEAERP